MSVCRVHRHETQVPYEHKISVSWANIISLKEYLYKGGSYLSKCYIKNKNHCRSFQDVLRGTSYGSFLFIRHPMGRITDVGSNVPWILDLDTTPTSTETSTLLLITRERIPGSNHIWVCVSEWAVLLYICSRKKIIISAKNRKEWSSPQPGTLLTYSTT